MLYMHHPLRQRLRELLEAAAREKAAAVAVREISGRDETARRLTDGWLSETTDELRAAIMALRLTPALEAALPPGADPGRFVLEVEQNAGRVVEWYVTLCRTSGPARR
jgi:hypothetical protein